MRDEIRPILKLLEELRARVRKTLLLRGAGIVVAAVAAAVVVSFLLDLLLDLPLAVRVVHLATVCGILALVAWRHLSRPMRTALVKDELAQAVEAGSPWMGDRLASALDFATRVDDPAEPESKILMRRVMADASSMAGRVQAADLVDPRPARRALLGGALAVATLAAVALAGGEDFSLWVRRGLLLEDAEWPRRTNVVVEGFPAENVLVVTRGDDLRIVARAEGDVPRDLDFHYDELSREGGDEVVFRDRRKMYPMQGDAGRFTLDLRAVSAPFRFRVTGGDDVDGRPVFTVKVIVPPRVASITALVDYPDYSGLASEEKEQPHLDVLEGSKVSFRLTANMPLSAARIVPAAAELADAGADPPAAPPPGEIREIEVRGEDRTELRFDVDVASTLAFHLELQSEDGHFNRPEDDLFRLVAVKDQPPTVVVLHPETRRYRTPEGLLPVKAVVTDDFGLGSVALDIRRGDGEAVTLPVWRAPEGDLSVRAVDTYVPADLLDPEVRGEEALRPGDMLYLVLRATDATGRVREADELTVEILSREDLENRLRQDQVRLRESLRRVTDDQRKVLEAVRRLRAGVGTSGPDAQALDAGRDAQVDQGRVTNDLAQFVSGVERVFDAQVLNRIGNPPTLEKILPLYDRHLRAPTAQGERVFGEALYLEVVGEKRADRLFDPDVLGTLIEILDHSDQALRQTAPAAYDALRQWGDRTGHPPEHLAAAEEHSVKLAEQLRLLDDRMGEWEAIGELVNIIGSIRNTEKELAKPLPLGGSGDKSPR